MAKNGKQSFKQLLAPIYKYKVFPADIEKELMASLLSNPAASSARCLKTD